MCLCAHVFVRLFVCLDVCELFVCGMMFGCVNVFDNELYMCMYV